MNTAGIRLGLALNNATSALSAARQKMASLDNAIAISPCLAHDGSLVANPLPARTPLPSLMSRYRVVREAADSLLVHLTSVKQQTRSDYDKWLKEALDPVGAAH
jgi:hypothetical protein